MRSLTVVKDVFQASYLSLTIVWCFRRELSAQFQKTIEEVSFKMDKQGQDYVASLKENEKYVCVPACELASCTNAQTHFCLH